MNLNRISLINTYSSTPKLFELLCINIKQYQNGKILLDVRSNYKMDFEFAHFLYKYVLFSLLTSRIRITRIRF